MCMKNNYILMARIFKIKRLMLGFSKRELARAVGISHTELSRIENFERPNYNVVTLINMCEVLQLNFMKLLKICGYLPVKNGDIDTKTLDYINEYQEGKIAHKIKNDDEFIVIKVFKDDF